MGKEITTDVEDTMEPDEDSEDNNVSTTPVKAHPVDKGWAWAIMIGSIGVHFMTIGYLRTLGILFVEFQIKFGSSSALTSAVNGVTSCSYSLITLMTVNVLMNHFTVRKICLAGCIFQFLGISLSGVVPDIRYLMLTQGVLFGTGQALLYCPTLVILSAYFEKRRAIATVISTCGVSAGGVAFPAMTRYLLDNYGLRGALLLIAAVVLQQLVFVSLFTPPDDYYFAPKHKANTDQDNECVKTHDIIVLEKLRDPDSDLESAKKKNTSYPAYTDHLNSVDDKVDNTMTSRSLPVLLTYLSSLKEKLPYLSDQNEQEHQHSLQTNAQEETRMVLADHTSTSLRRSPQPKDTLTFEYDQINRDQHDASERLLHKYPGETKIQNTIVKLHAPEQFLPKSLTDLRYESSVDPMLQIMTKSWSYENSIAPKLNVERSLWKRTMHDSPADPELHVGGRVSYRPKKQSFFQGRRATTWFEGPAAMRRNAVMDACSISSLDIYSLQGIISQRQGVDQYPPKRFSVAKCEKSEDEEVPDREKRFRCRMPDLAKTLSFWVVAVFFFSGGIGSALPAVFLPPLTKEKGLTADDAALFLMVSAILDLFGRLGPGLVLHYDCMRPTTVVIGPMTVCGILYQFTNWFNNFWAMMSLAVMSGLFTGAFWAMQSLVVIEVFGLDRLGPALGFYSLVVGFSTGVSYPIAGSLQDVFGSYAATYRYFGAMYLLGAFMMVLVQFTKKYNKGDDDAVNEEDDDDDCQKMDKTNSAHEDDDVHGATEMQQTTREN